MHSLYLSAILVIASGFRRVTGLSPTDEYRDADVAQSGYLPNHNMDPSLVDSAQFGQLWKIPFNNQEQFYAKPLTYTPIGGGPQLLFLASTQNWIRTLNAITGVIINSRQVAPPFMTPDLPGGCTDILNFAGIMGTPVIDPTTDTVYFFAKTYIPNFRIPGSTGIQNGVYYFYAIDVNTLQDVAGYPVLVDGNFAQNDPRRYFYGGVALQRPSLTQIGSVVYGGFGSHCDFYNYTGYIVGIDVKKAQVVTLFATEAGPLAPQSNDIFQNGGSGESSIWMSGAGLASDSSSRLFYTTGNGAGLTNTVPASRSSGLQTLSEAAVSMSVDPSGVLSVSDFFIPYDYLTLDEYDQDFGSSGITLLDPSTFHGASVSQIAVTGGKSGKIYILDANNLGGFKLGPAQTDAVIQVISGLPPLFGAVGSYPLESGYIYVTPQCSPTIVYVLGFSVTGLPVFTQIGQTNENSTCGVGSGVPTVTTYKGNSGTAILWITDPDAGLRAWHAVPINGILQTIALPQIAGANKWARPTFGDGKVYVTDSSGVLYCLGSSVASPLNCTSPVDFGNVAFGSSATASITCLANIALTSVNGATTDNSQFIVDNSSLPVGSLQAGATFSFPVTWDLTNTTSENTSNTTANLEIWYSGGNFALLLEGSASAPAVTSTYVSSPKKTGQSVYQYFGCFQDSDQLLPNREAALDANTNVNCKNTCYSSNQYTFTGIRNTKECWCGNNPPPLESKDASEVHCNATCAGDGNDQCGGSGYISIYYDPTKYNPVLSSTFIPTTSSMVSSSTISTTSSSVSNTDLSSSSISVLPLTLSTETPPSISTTSMTSYYANVTSTTTSLSPNTSSSAANTNSISSIIPTTNRKPTASTASVSILSSAFNLSIFTIYLLLITAV